MRLINNVGVFSGGLPARVVLMTCSMIRGCCFPETLRTPKSHDHQTSHINCGQKRRQRSNEPEDFRGPIG